MSNLSRPMPALNRIGIGMFYILTVAFLLLANTATLNAVTYEMGDFAANSLLIQDAKHFSLWMGNYSRVGFNHPGPAILYVLAAGEVVFHDWLHLVEYAFTGQIIAVAFYNALWITLTLIGLQRLTQSFSVAFAGLAVLLLTLGLMDFSFFNGIWMPHLYLFPFVVAVLALARIMEGKTDSLQALAVSSGFLINGHVSFVGILGVMLVVSLIGNYLMFRNRPLAGHPVASKGFLTRHKKPLLLSCLTLFVFFIPLLVKTVLEFPGPVAQYAGFSGGHTANSLAAASSFMAFYWGGALWASLGIALLVLAWWAAGRAGSELCDRIRAMVVVLIAATLAILFYARYGIDFLDEKYIGYFYYAAPALTVCGGALLLLSSPRIAGLWPLLLGGSTALLAGTFVLIDKPVQYNYLFRENGIAQAFETLQAQSPEGGLVLDLEDRNHEAWSAALGLGIYAKRHGVKLFCVNRNWHISLTPAYRCTDEEIRLGKHLMVTHPDQYPDQKPVLSAVGVSMYVKPTPTLALGSTLNIADSAQVLDSYLFSGWSTPEPAQVWTEGRSAHLLFRTSGKAGTVELDLEAFLPAAQPTQTVSFKLNGTAVTQAGFNLQSKRQRVRIAVPASDQVQDLQILIEKPISPKNAGISGDRRKLGVALHSLEFDGEQQ